MENKLHPLIVLKHPSIRHIVPCVEYSFSEWEEIAVNPIKYRDTDGEEITVTFDDVNKALAIQDKLRRVILANEKVDSVVELPKVTSDIEIAKKYLTPEEFLIVEPYIFKDYFFDLKLPE